jgi:hypothetical protein
MRRNYGEPELTALIFRSASTIKSYANSAFFHHRGKQRKMTHPRELIGTSL